MAKLIVILIISVALAEASQRRTEEIRHSGEHYAVLNDPAYLLLLLVLVLFTGLRTNYNDTINYIDSFDSAPTLAEFLANPENLNPFKNPLFGAYQSFLRDRTDDAQVLIFTTSLFTQACFLRFFKRYSKHFTFSVFIYITLGTFVFTLAAIKQTVAMAILTLAIPYLEKKKWVPYCLLVLIAMLVHTYAISFAVLPLFMVRPWKSFTYVFVLLMVVLMMNFREAISAFMDQANELGKTLADYEIFDDNTVNIFRLAVYAVTPLLSLIFQRWIFYESDEMDHVLVHMSIISLAFMSMGTQSGANMFARMAMYFELGTICCLPKMLEKTFDSRSYRLVRNIAVVCFVGFFLYAYAIAMDFDAEYRCVPFLELLLP